LIAVAHNLVKQRPRGLAGELHQIRALAVPMHE
jgi:hypothetical protein